MKQIVHSFKTGKTILEDIPCPVVQPGHILIQTCKTLVSLGTEKMLVEFGKANLIAKARKQPEKVKIVLDKIKSEGLIPTLENVFKKLDQPIPLGYCNVGKVIETGEGVIDFKIGDRVVSNGPHAEIVCVQKNFVAHIPDNISDEEATFTVIGSIGLQGIRLCNPSFGETIVVFGLGLIGLITGELLISNGCRVIGIEIDDKKIEIAKAKGILTIKSDPRGSPVEKVLSETGGIGADGVIITASSKSDFIIKQAAQMSRKRGRIILIGVIGLNISRVDFYEKELTFQVSCSYGPGRYDEEYEIKGNDYPLPYVRWTAKRNFEAVLNAISAGQLDVKPLITEIIPLFEYNKIYSNINKNASIASILSYSSESVPERRLEIRISQIRHLPSKGIAGIIGAGNYTQMTLLPALKQTDLFLKTIVSAGGLSATLMAKKYGIKVAGSDYMEILQDPDIDVVFITTRHNLHASMVRDALSAKKHVFVEKPLALTIDELNQIIQVYNDMSKDHKLMLLVGYNRRFSPHSQKIKYLIGENTADINIVATMNAGIIQPNIWIHDMKVGGGRIIGEACHLIDLLIYFTGSKVKRVIMNALGKNPSVNTDNASLLLQFENGANGSINYFSNGSKAYSKERVELYSGNRTIVLDNFTTTRGYGYSNFRKLKTKLDKGHVNQFKCLADSLVKGGLPVIPFDDIINSTKASFAVIESFKNKKWVSVDTI